MSLPDTVFIFVLALIIFGPKKLPEIGRQIGKLVGEFRRASNEFKFQIEEEMRQVEITEKAKPQPSIAAPAAQAPALAEAAENTLPDTVQDTLQDPAETLPVGQHPNIEMLNTAELNPTANVEPAAGPTITPAEGAEARTTAPFAAVSATTEILKFAEHPATENGNASAEIPASSNHTSTAAEAEISHG